MVAREQLSLFSGLGCIACRNLYSVSAGIASAAGRGVDRSRGDFICAARGEALDSDGGRHGPALRDSAAAVDSAQRNHAARISTARAEIFEFAGRTDSLRFHELGEDVALPISRCVSCTLEAE